MKILFVNHTSSLTGAPISCFHLMSGLGEGFKSVFASKEKGPLIDKLKEAGIKTYLVNTKGLLGLKYIIKFAKIIRDEKIDIIHLNTLTPFCKYAGIAGFLCRIPVVWVVREDPLISRSRRLRFWLKLLSSKIIFVDKDTSAKLLPEVNKKIEIIYNGVDLEQFKPSKSDYLTNKLGLETGQKCIGYIGSITKRKGIEYLIRAMPVIKDRFQDIVLIVIGDYKEDDKPYFLALKKIIDGLSLQKNIFFTGSITDIANAINSLDIVVLPSLDERCSRSLLESIACAKAVVATRVGGTPEIIEDGYNGFLVEPENDQEIAESVVTLLKDDALRQKMGERGRTLAKQKFELRNNIDKMRNLYTKLSHT